MTAGSSADAGMAHTPEAWVTSSCTLDVDLRIWVFRRQRE